MVIWLNLQKRRWIAIIPVILILILAFIALCNGDASGFEAIGKIILYIGLFIGVGAIIAYAPWLILIVIIGVIIWAVASSNNNSKNIYTNDNALNENHVYNQQQKENSEIVPIDNSNLTDFQRQLQENTKTPQQVEDENWLKEKEQISNTAKKDFSEIKRILLEKAQKGQYSTFNGYKSISIDYYCTYLMHCIHREHYYNPTGKIGTSSYRTNKKVIYSIDKMKQYNLYLDILKEFAITDNIDISPFFVEIDPIVYQQENKINLPYTYKHEWRTASHKIKTDLKCTIKY